MKAPHDTTETYNSFKSSNNDLYTLFTVTIVLRFIRLKFAKIKNTLRIIQSSETPTKRVLLNRYSHNF